MFDFFQVSGKTHSEEGGLPKIESLGRGSATAWGGVQTFLLKMGHKPEKGGLPLLSLFFFITFTLCEGKVRFPLLLFGSSVFRVSHARFSSNLVSFDLHISDPFWWSAKNVDCFI